MHPCFHEKIDDGTNFIKTQNCIKLWLCLQLLFSLSISLFSLSRVLREIENYASNEVGASQAVGRARLAMAHNTMRPGGAVGRGGKTRLKRTV